ncbi:MAG TPA: hypothetical protein VN381_04965 [Anaerovoracaceae bacterium]|nr:hypothetical protein [Anaerovoracaceae bacterium]
MKNYKLSVTIIFILAALVTVTGCQSLDVVAEVAVTSFDSLVKAVPDKVAFDGEKGGWAISGLDDKERVILSEDFSGSNPDITVEFEAAPFIDAGLDIEKLPGDQYLYDKSTGKITMPFKYGKDKFESGTEKSALGLFKEIVKTQRSIVGYHEEGDHYKIDLGNGNLFGWAKDMSANEADLIYILNPEPLIDAGVDTSKIKEWVFPKIPVTDKDGKQIQVEVFIKAFNIK